MGKKSSDGLMIWKTFFLFLYVFLDLVLLSLIFIQRKKKEERTFFLMRWLSNKSQPVLPFLHSNVCIFVSFSKLFICTLVFPWVVCCVTAVSCLRLCCTGVMITERLRESSIQIPLNIKISVANVSSHQRKFIIW